MVSSSSNDIKNRRRRNKPSIYWLILFAIPIWFVIFLPFILVMKDPLPSSSLLSSLENTIKQYPSQLSSSIIAKQQKLQTDSTISGENATISTTISIIDKRLRSQHRQHELSILESCAICFFGIPRSFQSLVLPSIIKYVLIPNKHSQCDIYMHFYQMNGTESISRSSYGDGYINTHQVPELFQQAFQEVYGDQLKTGDTLHSHSTNNKIHLSIIHDTNETFYNVRGKQIEKYMTTTTADGNLLYYPWMAKSYDETSIHNIIKQWHSISQVWSEMTKQAKILNRKYTRVAMLRNDVVYVTPFDTYQISEQFRDMKNEIVAVPNWARFPINDRMVYGPYDAIKIWSTERFTRLETHVHTYEEPGYGLHNERFLNHSIFPAMEELGFSIQANPEICFLRARADGSVWINDCATRNGAAIGFRNLDKAQRLVEELVGHSCIRSKFKARVVQLQCNVDENNATATI